MLGVYFIPQLLCISWGEIISNKWGSPLNKLKLIGKFLGVATISDTLYKQDNRITMTFSK